MKKDRTLVNVFCECFSHGPCLIKLSFHTSSYIIYVLRVFLWNVTNMDSHNRTDVDKLHFLVPIQLFKRMTVSVKIVQKSLTCAIF